MSNRKQILNKFMQQIWNQGDFSSLEQLVAEEYQVSQDEYDPWSGQTIDHQTFKQRVLYSRNAFPDLNFEIEQQVEDKDTVAISWIMSGTHRGDLPQLSATGHQFSIRGMTFYYFEEDKLCGHTQCFDQLSFIRQMGLLAANK